MNSRKTKALRVGIVCSLFNEFVVRALLDGAQRALTKHGVPEKNVEVFWVPGAYEIPVMAKLMALSRNYDALVALGAVIRGETAHFDYVAGEAAKGLANVQNASGVPVTFGVLTTNTTDQAIDRAGGKSGNKGYDAAITAIETASVLRQIRGQ